MTSVKPVPTFPHPALAKAIAMIGDAEASTTEKPGRDAVRQHGATLEIRNFTKRFPGVLAVDDLDLTIEPGAAIAPDRVKTVHLISHTR